MKERQKTFTRLKHLKIQLERGYARGINSMQKNKTVELVKLSKHQKPLKIKYVFKVKETMKK